MSIHRFAAALVLVSTAAWAQTSDLEKGKQLFLGMCSRCHGLSGAGGEGPNLNRPVLTNAPDDEALRAVIRDGIPERGMPRIRRFTDAELTAMVVFVRSLGHTASAASAGNAANGKAVYQRQGCSSCHTIAGEGGILGPELTDIGAHRAPDYLRQSIVEPAAALPRGVTAVPGRGFDEFLPVRVVSQSGQEVRGVRVNEDSFTIQVRDAGGRLYSFRKADLKQLDKQMGKTLMPDYKGKVSGSDLDDLVAYLGSLGGAK
jgi:cytochrome c oxidase cbb3-type subunit III